MMTSADDRWEEPMADTKNIVLRLDESLADKVRTVADVEGTTVSSVIRDALVEHVERRRQDPAFQVMLTRNLQRHQELLSMLADG